MREWVVVVLWLASLKTIQLFLDRYFASDFVKRKSVHVIVGFSVIPLAYWIQDWYVAAVPVAMILAANAKSNLKGEPSRSLRFQTYALLGFLAPAALILNLWREDQTRIVVIAVLMMTLGDAAAAIGGRRWGRRKFSAQTGKTLEGSLCNLAVSFITVFVFTRSFLISLVSASAGAAIEAMAPGVWDNPAVLIATMLILLYFNNVQ